MYVSNRHSHAPLHCPLATICFLSLDLPLLDIAYADLKKKDVKKKKKDVQLDSFELSFIWGKMRTAAQEAASQIAPRDCSKAAVGKSQYIRFW